MARIETSVTTASPFAVPIKLPISFHYVLFSLCQFSERISPSLFKPTHKPNTHQFQSHQFQSPQFQSHQFQSALQFPLLFHIITLIMLHCPPRLHAQAQCHRATHSASSVGALKSILLPTPPTHRIYIIYLKMSVCLSLTPWTAQSSSDS